jgi:molybdate transport system regulatory protein
LLVDTMNRCWKEPLVATGPGNARGGGAWLNPLGERVLAHYRSLQQRLDSEARCPDRAALAEAMLDRPKESQKA